MVKKYIIDSNCLIEYVGKSMPEVTYIKISKIIDEDFNISIINKIEVLGHPTTNKAWTLFIDQATLFNISEEIVDRTIEIRKNYKIKVPDAIIAATALANDLILITRNIDDFKRIKGLKVENPWLWI